MWRLYSRLFPEAVAIRTSVGALRETFKAVHEPIVLGGVRYADDLHAAEEARLDLTGRMLRKTKAFEHEREVRALRILDKPSGKDSYFCPLPDPKLLVTYVLVSPVAAEWFLNLCKSVTRRYCPKINVFRSRLALNGGPRRRGSLSGSFRFTQPDRAQRIDVKKLDEFNRARRAAMKAARKAKTSGP